MGPGTAAALGDSKSAGFDEQPWLAVRYFAIRTLVGLAEVLSGISPCGVMISARSSVIEIVFSSSICSVGYARCGRAIHCRISISHLPNSHTLPALGRSVRQRGLAGGGPAAAVIEAE